MTLEETQRQRESVATIHDVVGAMRAVAAGRIQGAQRALLVARRYEEIVLRALAAASDETLEASLAAIARSGPTLVVMTSEQPLCGSFNQNVLALFEQRYAELRQRGEVQLLVVGQRGLRLVAGRNIEPTASAPAASSVQGLRDVVKRIAALAGHQLTARRLGPLHVLYNRYQSLTEQIPTEERILPLDPALIPRPEAQHARRCLRYLSSPDLVAGLVTEYAFIRMYRIAADSFASEQASRLVAMDGATRNTERILASLTDLERRERQGEITRQVLELLNARFTHEE